MMASEDKELKSLMNKRLKEMSMRPKPQPKAPTSRDVVVSHLYDRGLEVLTAAEAQYPSETKLIEDKLAELYKTSKLSGQMSGGELLYLFRTLGMYVSIETSIKVEEHGRFVDLSEKLKGSG